MLRVTCDKPASLCHLHGIGVFLCGHQYWAQLSHHEAMPPIFHWTATVAPLIKIGGSY